MDFSSISSQSVKNRPNQGAGRTGGQGSTQGETRGTMFVMARKREVVPIVLVDWAGGPSECKVGSFTLFFNIP